MLIDDKGKMNFSNGEIVRHLKKTLVFVKDAKNCSIEDPDFCKSCNGCGTDFPFGMCKGKFMTYGSSGI
jgi:hypothetical protein